MAQVLRSSRPTNTCVQYHGCGGNTEEVLQNRHCLRKCIPIYSVKISGINEFRSKTDRNTDKKTLFIFRRIEYLNGGFTGVRKN